MFQINKPEIKREITAPLLPKVALVFHSDEGRSNVVSRHTIKNGKVSRGVIVSMAHTMALVKGLSKANDYSASSISLNNPNILFESADRLVWFKPSVYAPMWFSNSNKPAVSYKVNWTSLIFDVNKRSGTMRICSTTTSTLPSLNKKVYLSPIWNLNSSGDFCLGAARLPKIIDASTISECEACVFDSQFTHRNTDNLFKGDVDDKSYLKKIRELSLSKEKFKAKYLNKMTNSSYLKDWLGSI